MILRPYQADLIGRLRESMRAGARRPLLVLPTGGGKTAIIAHVVSGYARAGRRALVLVHRVELLRQCSDTLTRAGVPHTCLGAGARWQDGAGVVVASVQTIARRDVGAWSPDIIVIDEGHHATAATWLRLLERWPTARALGVTATPCRTDGRGLGEVYDSLVVGPTVSELVAGGYLAPSVVYAPPRVADLAALRTRAGDYTGASLDDVMDRRTVTGDAVAHYRRLCDGAPAIAFCASVSHAQHVAEAFAADGYAAASVDGGTDGDVRADRIAALGDGRLQVLTSCEIISEGTDVPVVTAAILLRPTMSTGLYMQQVGRVMRPAPGKAHAIVLDHVGSVLQHGMPDDDRVWTLDGAPARAQASQEAAPAAPMTCEACYCQIRRPAPPACPHCGHTLPAPESRRVDDVAGDLVPLTREQVAAARKVEAERVARLKRAEQTAARSLDELRALGARRGYSPRWADRVWEARGYR